MTSPRFTAHTPDARRRLSLLAAALLAVVAVAPLPAASASAQDDWCRDVNIIGAAGSGELYNPKTGSINDSEKVVRGDGKPGNHYMGKEVYYMASRLEGLLSADQESVRLIGLVWKNASTDVLKPSKVDVAKYYGAGALGGLIVGPGVVYKWYRHDHLDPYIASINQGVSKLKSELSMVVSRCPDSDVILAGYSQGAMVVKQAELQLAAAGQDDILDAVVATILLGDGDRSIATTAHLIGDGDPQGQGVRPYLLGAEQHTDVWDPETTVEICAPKDLICDFNLDRIPNFSHALAQHTRYTAVNNWMLDQAVDWTAQQMGLTDS